MTDTPATGSPGTLPGAGLAGRYVKSDAGRAEIRGRALPLSRSARNLLLIIDASRSAEGWLAVVQGCGPADLVALWDAGLVAPTAAGAGAAPGSAASATGNAPALGGVASLPPGGAASPPPGRQSLAQALEGKGYQLLYARITAEARPRLGLFKSYKLILEVERCNGPAEIRLLAQRFVEQVREADGDAAGLALALALIAPE